MNSDGTMVIDLGNADWSATPADLVAAVCKDAPEAIRISADHAPAVDARALQLIVAIARHAQAAGIPVSVEGQSNDLDNAVARFGLTGDWPGQGANAA